MNDDDDRIRAWNIIPEKLSKFLGELQEFGGPYSNGEPWMKEIRIKDAGLFFVVMARSSNYPYQEKALKKLLEETEFR